MMGLKVKCVTMGNNPSEYNPHSESCHTHWYAFNYQVVFQNCQRNYLLSTLGG